MTGISFYCFLWRLISVRRVRASNGRQNRFLYRSHRNGQSRKNIVFMRLCGVSGIHFLRRGEQIILLFFKNNAYFLFIFLLFAQFLCLFTFYTFLHFINILFIFAFIPQIIIASRTIIEHIMLQSIYLLITYIYPANY